MISRLGLLLPVLVFLGGCVSHTDIGRIPVPPPIPNLSASLSMPRQTRALVNVPISLTLSDTRTRKPVTGANIRLLLDMPSMAMPATPADNFSLRAQGPGIYSGSAIFTMPGKWEATATIFDAEGRYARRSFPVQVK